MNLTITDRMTGEMGALTVDGRFAGPVTVVLRGEDYSGTFSAVRGQARIPPFGGWFVAGTAAMNGETADTGMALAYVRSTSGKSLDCGFQYSIGGLGINPTLGMGRCRDETGRYYDVQAATE
jgi:hypothetical protein